MYGFTRLWLNSIGYRPTYDLEPDPTSVQGLPDDVERYLNEFNHYELRVGRTMMADLNDLGETAEELDGFSVDYDRAEALSEDLDTVRAELATQSEFLDDWFDRRADGGMLVSVNEIHYSLRDTILPALRQDAVAEPVVLSATETAIDRMPRTVSIIESLPGPEYPDLRDALDETVDLLVAVAIAHARS